MGPLASCLNKESDHSFILKEVYPDKAHSVKPLVCFQARDEWVNIAVTLQGQTLYFRESLRKSQYRLLKYDRDYLKVTLDSLLMFIFRCYFPFPKSRSTCTSSLFLSYSRHFTYIIDHLDINHKNLFIELTDIFIWASILHEGWRIL